MADCICCVCVGPAADDVDRQSQVLTLTLLADEREESGERVVRWYCILLLARFWTGCVFTRPRTVLPGSSMAADVRIRKWEPEGSGSEVVRRCSVYSQEISKLSAKKVELVNTSIIYNDHK